MSGDLSLTQALGGLRIANPDDSISSSPPPPEDHVDSLATTIRPSPSSYSSNSSATATLSQHRPQLVESDSAEENALLSDIASTPVTPGGLPALDEDAGFLPTPVDYTHQLNHRQSMPLAHQAQQQSQYPAQPIAQMVTNRGYPTGATRPTSGIYNHANASGGSQTSASNYSAYRYGDEPPQPVIPPQRAASTATHGRYGNVAVNPRGGTEYMLAGNNLPPPRRSSRRISPGASHTSIPSTNLSSTQQMDTGLVQSSEEWKEKGAAVGIRREVDANGRMVTKVTKKGVKDFDFGRTLGEGSYSTVLAATDRTTMREYAIKVLDKHHIIKEKKVKYVGIEKDTLNRLNDHPGIVRLYYTFQDERSLYFVLDLASNGELLGVLKKMGTFDVECTQFYGAQILDAINYMHSRGVLHRDLKPENVLLDSHMHVKITDFGTGKILDDKQKATENGGDIFPKEKSHRAVSFVGTAEYVSPELLTAKEGGKPTDLWAFGCIIYQLLTGRPPFKGATEYLTFDKILKLDYSFPSGFPPVARDLVERLLVPDPSKRLTVDHCKHHEFFDGIHWGRSLWSQKAPRLKSYVPPASEPIRLNGPNSLSAPMTLNPTSQPRAHARLITELPAPTQLDIDWSPVLTRQNERILRLGNLVVTVSPQPHSPHAKTDDAGAEAPKKFSRFFMSGPMSKKRQRLVMVTSSARIVLAASGGDEKKAKLEIPLLGNGTSWRCFKDTKGLTQWCVDTREKHILFEAPTTPPPEPDGTAIDAAEWMEILARARELALTQHSLNVAYSGDSTLDMSTSRMSSPGGSSLGAGDNGYFSSETALDGVNIPSTSRLRKEEDAESLRKGRKRFSRRQSKGGLAAVF